MNECWIWDNCDFGFTCSGFEGNPYDIRLWGIFSGPGRETLRVPGFYDGDGQWIIRFMPPSPGQWDFVTESDISELNGRKGSVTSEQRSAEHGAKGNCGQIVVRRDNPQYLMWENGDAYFLLGFEADWLGLIDFDPKQGSEECGEDIPHARQFIDEIAEQGFNHVVMNVYAHDVHWEGKLGRDSPYDFSNPPLWPFGGTNDNPRYDELNPVFFRKLDKVVMRLREKALICHLMIYVWNKKVAWPGQNSPQDKRYFDYVLARYMGFSNIVWDVSKEALTYGYCGPEYIRSKCLRVRELDVYRHLLTVHDKQFCEAYPDLVDIISVQDWRSGLYELMMSMRTAYTKKPVYNIEHGGYEASPFLMAPGDYEDPAACLERNYLCVFAGVYSTYYWQGCSWNILCYEPSALPFERQPRFDLYKKMHEFFTRFPFHEYAPVAEGIFFSNGYALRSGDDRFLLLKRAESYCVHFRKQDNFSSASVEWFNPLTGMYHPEEIVPLESFTVLRSPWKDQFSVAVIKLNR